MYFIIYNPYVRQKSVHFYTNQENFPSLLHDRYRVCRNENYLSEINLLLFHYLLMPPIFDPILRHVMLRENLLLESTRCIALYSPPYHPVEYLNKCSKLITSNVFSEGKQGEMAAIWSMRSTRMGMRCDKYCTRYVAYLFISALAIYAAAINAAATMAD